MKIIPILIIICLLGVGGWAHAQIEPLQEGEVKKISFLPKVRLYLQQVWREIEIRAESQIKQPLRTGNSRLDKQLRRIRVDFYKEVEEMRLSLIKLLKAGWNKVK